MRAFIFLILLFGAANAQADNLLIDAIYNEPPNRTGALPRPTRGMAMANVEQRFGPPAYKSPWVGDPPITRWAYDQFTVYFENDRVIRAVVHH